MGIVLVPVSDSLAQENLHKSIYSKISLSRLEDLISEEELCQLKSVYPSGKASVWGTNLNVDGKVKLDWEQMRPDDLVLFGSKPSEGVLAMARLVTIIRSSKCSKEIWGEPRFECLYFLTNVVTLEPGLLLKSEVNKRLLKKGGLEYFVEHFHWPGLQRIPADRSYELVDTLENQPEHLFRPNSGSAQGIALTLPDNLDGLALAPTRKEQAELRSLLLGGEREANCALCNQLIPAELLVAGHIKKRSLCNQDEKRDLAHIGTLFCKLGCDDLYEQGWFSVDTEGSIITRTSGATDAILEILSKFSGKHCVVHSEGNKGYFEHHRNFWDTKRKEKAS